MDGKQLARAVGQAIARERKRCGFTQAFVAEKLGIEKETVSRIENGAIAPTLARLQQCAALFGCSAGEFFWLESGENEQNQGAAIADMIRSLPEEKRDAVLRMVAEMVRMAKG